MAKTIVLSRASRTGEATSAGVQIPANATGFVTLGVDMSDADLEGAGRSGSLYIEVTDDAGSTWRVVSGISWATGRSVWRGVTLPPSIGIPAAKLAGRTVRLRAPLDARYNIGLSVDVQ